MNARSGGTYDAAAKIFVNGERLKNTIETFADYGRTDNNGVTRLSLTEEDLKVREYFCACCEELGMSVKMDDMGTMYATLAGVASGPPIVIGSHMDTVKKAADSMAY